MNNRKELIEEQVLRENIRKAIKIVRDNRKTLAEQEEAELRVIIRKMLTEEKTPVACLYPSLSQFPLPVSLAAALGRSLTRLLRLIPLFLP